jgi:cytochrome P450
MVMFFFIAGYDTSKNVMTYTMYTLLSHPDIYQRCGESYEYCRKLIEEALRYFNPGTAFRFVDKDMVYRDVLLKKDTMLFFPLSVSGQDPGSFANATVFDPDRITDPNKRHIDFGLGKHMCLGQHLARAQLEEAFHQIPQRLKGPKLAGEFGWRPFYGTWGLKGLPIRFTPTAASVAS